MPRKPKKPCKHPGCPRLTERDYCEEHALLHVGDRAGKVERGYNRLWRIESKHFLMMNPLCICCQKQGLLVKATVVDHIVPHRGDKEFFWDVKNWQPLCKRCHDHKTMTEDRYQEYKY